MAQRAVDMTARYFSCLSARCDADFFRIGNASPQRPLAARLMPRSAEDEASTGGAFGETCAGTRARDDAKSPPAQRTTPSLENRSARSPPAIENLAIECSHIRSLERDPCAPRSITCDPQLTGGDGCSGMAMRICACA